MPDERTIVATTDDEELRRYQDGEAEALDRLWTRHYPALRRWATAHVPRSLRAQSSAEDLVQDTFLRSQSALLKLRLNRPNDLFHYLRVVVLNQIRDHARQSARRPERVDHPLDQATDGRPSALDALLGREALEHCQRAMAGLTEMDRRLVAAGAARHSDRETAALLGKPTPNAARVARRRACARLAKMMAAL
jgi:RNA polymerase sigma factor (sigma-70 family)